MACSTADDRANITRTTDLLSQATGSRPVGWISPRGTPGPGTAGLLLEAGYTWQGDVFDDDRPYVVRDLLSGARYTWRGVRNYVRLDPAVEPGHLLLVHPPAMTRGSEPVILDP